jgi:hypothetical protein
MGTFPPVLGRQEESMEPWPFSSTSSREIRPLSDHGWRIKVLSLPELHPFQTTLAGAPRLSFDASRQVPDVEALDDEPDDDPDDVA